MYVCIHVVIITFLVLHFRCLANILFGLSKRYYNNDLSKYFFCNFIIFIKIYVVKIKLCYILCPAHVSSQGHLTISPFTSLC
jgi:hypothetical protein